MFRSLCSAFITLSLCLNGSVFANSELRGGATSRNGTDKNMPISIRSLLEVEGNNTNKGTSSSTKSDSDSVLENPWIVGILIATGVGGCCIIVGACFAFFATRGG